MLQTPVSVYVCLCDGLRGDEECQEMNLKILKLGR